MSARKRKQSVPKKSTEEKRLKMTWNMFDFQNTDSFVVPSDQSFGRLDTESRTSSSEVSSKKENYKRRPKRHSRVKGYQHNTCARLRIDHFFPPDFICVLGTFELLAVPADIQDFKSLLGTAELNHLQLESFSSVTVLVRFNESKPLCSNDETTDVVQAAQEIRAVVLNATDQQLEAIEYLESKGILRLVKKGNVLNQGNCLEVHICLCKGAVTSVAFASEDTILRKCDKMMQVLMSWLFPSIIPDDESESSEFEQVSENSGSNFDDLYDAVKTIRESVSGTQRNKDENDSARAISIGSKILNATNIIKGQSSGNINVPCQDQPIDYGILSCTSVDSGTSDKPSHIQDQENEGSSGQPNQVLIKREALTEWDEPGKVQHPNLIPQLREYQKKAVHWMLARELINKNTKEQDDSLHVLWREIKVCSGTNVFYNPFTGRISLERYSVPPLPSGGILADEMGLGKTVEVLACILNNPRCTTLEKCHGSKELQEFTKSDKENFHENSQFCNGQIQQGRMFKQDWDSLKEGFSSQKGNDAVLNLIDLANTGEVCEENSDNINCQEKKSNHSLVATGLELKTCNGVTKPSQTELNNVQSINMQSCVTEDSNGDACSTTDSIQPNPGLYGNRVNLDQKISSNDLTCSGRRKTASLDFKSNVVKCNADDKNSLFTNCDNAECVKSCRRKSKPFLDKNGSFEFNLKSLCMDKLHQNGFSCHFNDLNMTQIVHPTETTSTVCRDVSHEKVVACHSRWTPMGHFHENLVHKSKSCATSTGKESACTDNSLYDNSTSLTKTVPLTSNGSEIQSEFKENLTSTSGKEVITENHNDSLYSSLDIQTTTSCFCMNKQEGLLCDIHHECQSLNQSSGLSCNQRKISFLECVANSDSFNSDKCEILSSESADQVKENVSCICGDDRPGNSQNVMQCRECNITVHEDCFQYCIANQFICPQCAMTGIPLQSRATLIISPASIVQQWREEIERHTEPATLKLLVYQGVSKQGFIPPDFLANHDVILTTYSTLRADFYHLGVKQASRSRRYHQRYAALPCPLTAIHFWRICLDEAQMVESTTAKAAEMALQLQCVHRWCVTGTPIQRGLDDIYGLFLFLGVYPYCQKVWWKRLLYEPYINNHRQPMYEVLAKVMWRSAKKGVLHEIQLPGQTEHTNWLTFTPVEQHFYHRQHEDCSAAASKMLSGWQETDTKLSNIDRHTVHQMLYPLLRLRQACCHPQAVRGGFLSLQKSMLTMDKLLDSLIARAKLECEEAHRQLLFALNGLAGIHIIKKEWPEAVECYRGSMRSWKEHEDKFKTDSLQKLHTVHNLCDMLNSSHPGCSHSLADDQLQEQSLELRRHYMLKPAAQVETAQQNLALEQRNIEEIESQVDFKDPWWIKAIHHVVRAGRGLQEELLTKIRNDLVGTEFLDRFSDLAGLQYIVTNKLDMMESTRASLDEVLNKLSVEPSADMVRTTAECCLRPVKDSHAKRCEFCEADDVFTEYESRLFGHQGMQGIEADSVKEGELLDWHRHGNTGGLRADTDTEKALKALYSFVRSQRLLGTSDKQEAQSHLTFIEARKKEFKFLRAIWFALREHVSALDELDMCTTRLRLLLPGEQLADDKHVIHPLQVEQQRMKFISDRISAQTELRKKLGQLLYLSNLAKTQNATNGENPDLCPVCTKRLGVQWSVFSCGHCFCCQCVWVLLRQAGAGPRGHGNVNVKCPMCRVPTLAHEISYVSTARQQSNNGEEEITVQGSHSTKVEAVVRTLLRIQRTDSSAKCLVFSTWQDVLDVIASALKENDVLFLQICGNKNFQVSLHNFKHDPDIGVLLLPLHSGSNGLNIIEATHVLLVEPSLNPAHELQAVGRVHRIGQTRPTHVHRFIIRGTVESRMYSLLRSKSSSVIRTGSRDTENSSLTVGDLAQLFTDELDDQSCTSLPGPRDQCVEQED